MKWVDNFAIILLITCVTLSVNLRINAVRKYWTKKKTWFSLQKKSGNPTLYQCKWNKRDQELQYYIPYNHMVKVGKEKYTLYDLLHSQAPRYMHVMQAVSENKRYFSGEHIGIWVTLHCSFQQCAEKPMNLWADRKNKTSFYYNLRFSKTEFIDVPQKHFVLIPMIKVNSEQKVFLQFGFSNPIRIRVSSKNSENIVFDSRYNEKMIKYYTRLSFQCRF